MNGQKKSLWERVQDTRFVRWALRFKQAHLALWQLILFNLLSLCATLTDLAVFSLLDYWLLTPWKTIGVTWWLLDYPPASGGLAALVSTAAAYLCAQVVNFFVQRKGTFQANNSVAASGAMYFVMIVLIWFFQIWFSALLLRWFLPVLGEYWGGLMMRLANSLVSLIIQFPMNKFVIMRQKHAAAADETTRSGRDA